MDPGAVLVALLGSANLASRHAVFHQYDSTVGADTVAGPGRGRRRPARQGHDEGARRDDGRQPVRRRDRPVAGRRAVGRRGDAQRLDHRGAAARRHELPQLRRSDPARGVLAAVRGRPRPRRRVPRARAAGHRRQRLALQRVAGRGRSRRRPRSASSACSTTSRRSSGPAFAAAGDAILLVGDAVPGLAGSAYAALAGAAVGGRPADASTSRARRPSSASSARRSRVGSSPPRRTCRAAVSRSPSRSARCGAASGRACACRSPIRRRSTCSARARRGSS